VAKTDAKNRLETWDSPEQAFDEAYNQESLRTEMVERRLERLEAAMSRVLRELDRLAPQPGGGAFWGSTWSDIEVRHRSPLRSLHRDRASRSAAAVRERIEDGFIIDEAESGE